MRKRIVTIIMFFCFIISVMPNVFIITAIADSTDDAISARIDTLYSMIGNTYFNVSHSYTGCGAKYSNHSCDECYTPNIVNAQWFINLFGYCSTSNFANSYGDGTTYTRAGRSCLGFANFAEWFIFKPSDGGQVSTTKIGTFSSNLSNYQTYAKIGDEIRFGNSHSAIYISADSNGIYVLDSNWSGTGYNCCVQKHYVPFSYTSTFTISRATNRDSIAPPKPPTNCWITTNKPKYAINENVTFYFSSDDASQMYITFYKDGIRREDLDINVTGKVSISKTYSEQGNYEIYLYAVTPKGDVSSEKVLFSVLPLPSDIRMNLEKLHFSKDENISFFYSSKDATNMYLVFFKDGDRREDLDLNISNTTHTARKLNEAGQYDIYILATNVWGEASSNYITFYVDNGPKNIYIKTDKLIYDINDFVNFSFSADDAEQMYLTFYKDGIRREDLDVNVSNLTNISKKYSELGLYEVYICAVNGEGQSNSYTTCFNITNNNISYSTIYNGHTYVLFDAITNWDSANAECKRIGGHLVTITSSQEQQFLKEFANNGTLTSYWIGASDVDKMGSWKWQNGENMNYTNWDINEPNNAKLLEHYAALYKQTGKWNDYDASGEYLCGFICEFDYEYEEYIPPHTETQVVKNGNAYNISVESFNLENCSIIVVGYKNNKVLNMEILNNDNLQTAFTGDFDTFKVMAWESFSNLKPLCEAEIIPQNKWIIE